MITGMENTYKALLSTKVKAAIAASTGSPPVSPNNIDDLSLGFAEATIEFLTTNAAITIPAAAINTSGSASAQVGPPAPVILQLT